MRKNEEMSFKVISYLELWRPFCPTEWNHLCNFGKGHFEQKFCEIILNLDQDEMSLKDISNLELWQLGGAGPFVQL